MEWIMEKFSSQMRMETLSSLVTSYYHLWEIFLATIASCLPIRGKFYIYNYITLFIYF